MAQCVGQHSHSAPH